MKRRKNNRLILAVASVWQLGICAWVLLSSALSGSEAMVLVPFAATGLIGLLTAAFQSCPSPWPLISMLAQVAGVAGAFVYAFTVPTDPYAPLAPIIMVLFVGPAIIVALIATWRHRDNAPINIADTPAGFCDGCNYDLKGTLESGRLECPECGQLYDPNKPPAKADWLLIVLIIVLVLNMIGNGTCGILMLG